MAQFDIDTKKAIVSSMSIMQTAKKMERIRGEMDRVRTSNGLEDSSLSLVRKSLRRLIEDVSEEAAKMDSLGDALEYIAKQYESSEKAISGSSYGDARAAFEEAKSDKRNWWQKFVDWITQKKPDKYDTTTNEQEKAADAAMKKKMWKVLQDEKYSPEYWDKATVKERKQILQDYMDELIKIYGLKDVKSKIVWDNLTYTQNSITWGHYTHGKHKVTLNEQALSDTQGGWDSYDLLETVAHELRHAYQHEAVDHPTDFMVSKETIDRWDQNFKNYISSSTDYNGYRNQPVEVDARDFQVSRDGKY